MRLSLCVSVCHAFESQAFIYDNSVVQTTVTYAQTSTRKPKF
jgi:hypothetical protein